MRNKEERAARLFDEIGLIDDRFIYEAATPYKAKSSRKGIKIFLVLAATLSVLFCMLVGSLVIGSVLIYKVVDNIPENEVSNDSVNNSDITASHTLESRLEGVREDTEALSVSPEELDLFDQSPAVIWKYSDEGTYRVYNLSSAEANELSRLLQSSSGTKYTENASENDTLDGLWISSGDGTVISPYLELSKGNIGYGELFDYSKEYEPSEEFSTYLCEIIS